jgi:hypothetical protein
MERRINFFQNRKNLIAFILFAAFWFSVVLICGTLKSGFHFTDDHQIITFSKSIDDSGFFNTCRSAIREDLNIRFRIFYYFHRVIETSLFGANFFRWSVYHAILAIFTSFCLYLFLERQGYAFSNALLFPFLTLIGNQSTIWWKLGPAETIGFFVLSVSLFFLANAIYRKKNYQLLISCFFLLLATLSKESFVFFIPAYLLLLLWLQQQKYPDKAFTAILKGNLLIILFLSLILLTELYVIVFLIGTNKIGYAGTDEHFSIFKLVKFIYLQLQENYLYLFLMGFGFFLLLQSVKNLTFKSLLDLKKATPYLFNVLILLAIIFPQFVLYAKSGFNERYLLPFVLGFSIFICYLLHKTQENKNITLFTKKIFAIVICCVIYFYFKTETLYNARMFTMQGKMTQNFLTSIIDHSKENDPVLIAMNSYENYEWSYSINTYLAEIGKRKNVLFYPVSIPLNDDFAKTIDKNFFTEFKGRIVTDLSDRFSCIAVFPFSVNQTIKAALDTNAAYRRIDFDNFNYYTVYVKK